MNKNKSIWAELYASEENIMCNTLSSDNIDFEEALIDRLNTLQEEAEPDNERHCEIVPVTLIPGMDLLDSQKQKAYSKMLRQVMASIKAKKFEQAQHLRMNLYELNPNASKIIFKTGQLIEAEKNKSEADSENKDAEQEKEAASVIVKGDEARNNKTVGYAAIQGCPRDNDVAFTGG